MIKIDHLTIEFDLEKVVNDLSFEIEQGEIFGIVGESGSGKTMTALTIAGLLPADARLSGSVSLNSIELTTLSVKERLAYQGKEISMVFQEPMSSLNPVMKIGKQLDEMLTLHTKFTKVEKKEKIIEALRVVELANPELIYDKYPFELSGGMQQRVMIAMALLAEPKLIIADEPTTALDVEVQKQILKLFKKINSQCKTSILFISHDLNVVRELCDKVIVMHKGRMVEQGITQEVFNHPKNSYTKDLIDSVASEYKQIIDNNNENILEVKDLTVFYQFRTKSLFGKKTRQIIIEHFNMEIKRGEILGIVGRSGSGKTTLCNAIIGLHNDYIGDIIHFSEMPQMVFQDVYGSLNPVKTIGWILEEPLRIQNKLDKQTRIKLVIEMMNKVGLPTEFKDRYPNELSGGQRQRVNIALALMLGSKLIIADEPVSSLDVTIQAQILNILLALQKEFNLSILFISHDRNVLNKICDRIIKI